MAAVMDQGMTQLLLATNNAGKQREFQALLGDLVRVRTMAEIGLSSPPETGTTFAENAALKALHAARAGQMTALADDSGLEVDALDGSPGVLSARYAGEPSNDKLNRALLLEKLAGVATPRRGARFVCALAIATPSGTLEIVEGTLAGRITRAERGDGGFGYDSIFELPDGRTMAELSTFEKSQISHRAQAFHRALPILSRMMHSTSVGTS